MQSRLDSTGKDVVPEAGGSVASHAPLRERTFDIVAATPLSITCAMSPAPCEMLRVLRTGGWLLTTGDPFRADGREAAELDCLTGTRMPFSASTNRSDLRRICRNLVANEDRLNVVILAP
jgi:hypothetical protein